MKTIGKTKEFDLLFARGRTPALDRLPGEYLVDMLTLLPSLRRLGHRKKFIKETAGVSGCNILFGRMIWGHFRVREAVCDRFGGRRVLEIDYDRQENGPLTRRIRDHLVYLEKQRIYLGRFNLCYRHTLHFYGYFSLTKITAD